MKAPEPRLTRAVPFAFLALALTAGASTSNSVHLFESKPSAAPTALPAGATNDGDFELTSVPVDPPAGSPSYSPWTFGAGTGIAHENSSTIDSPGPAPSGDYVAYITGSGQFTVPVQLNAGVYRLRYSLANTVGASAPATEHTVRIAYAGMAIAEDEDVGSAFNEFVTRPFKVRASGQVKTVSFTGKGDATGSSVLDDIRIEEVHAWDDPLSWVGNTLPPTGADVVIPSDSAVALLGNQAVRTVTIEGELVMTNNAASLTADLIDVTGSGARLEMGRRRVPLTTNVTIELSGSYQANDVTGHDTPADHKALRAMNGGVLELHGRHKTSWTHLTATANPGATYVEVQDVENWSVGDQIVVVGSERNLNKPAHVDPPPPYVQKSEVRTIESIVASTYPGGPITYQLYLGEEDDAQVPDTLDYLHHGGAPLSRTVNGSVLTLDQRAEVGMLSRNLVVTSTPVVNGPTPAYGANAGYGGHIVVMGSNDDPQAPTGRARVSNVELKRLGRSRSLARYPFHWHMNRDSGAGQYLANCSIRQGFNRAVTIHGTDEALVEDNFAFEILGHAMFLEDGSEMDNVVRGNLVAAVLRPEKDLGETQIGDQTIASDNGQDDFQGRSPAAFWISNPSNVFDDNVAADTVGVGYWLVFSPTVHGLSKVPNDGHNWTQSPRLLDLGSFAGNVAHGCAMGLDVHDGVNESPDPLQQTIRKNMAWMPASGNAELEDFSHYACWSGVYSGIAPGTVTFLRARSADNEDHYFLASYDEVRESMLIADAGNDLAPTDSDEFMYGYRTYDGAGRLIDCYAEGFEGATGTQPDRALVKSNNAATHHPNHRVVNLQSPVAQDIRFMDFACHISGGTGCQSPLNGHNGDLNNATNWANVVLDVDGSLSGTTGPTSIVTNAPMLLVSGETDYQGDPHVKLSSRRFAQLEVRMPVYTEASMVLPAMRILRTHPTLPGALYNASPVPVPFGNPQNVPNTFQQTPVIVNDGFEYGISIFVPSGDLPLPAATGPEKQLELVVGDNELGDEVLIELKNFHVASGQTLGNPPTHTVDQIDGVVATVSTLAALESATVTTTFYDNVAGGGSLWFKVVQEHTHFDPITGDIEAVKEDTLRVTW